jgi:hypothetical protein
LQGLGELDQPHQTSRRAHQPIAHQDQALGRDQHFRKLRDRAGIRLRRHHEVAVLQSSAQLRLAQEAEERRRSRSLTGA